MLGLGQHDIGDPAQMDFEDAIVDGLFGQADSGVEELLLVGLVGKNHPERQFGCKGKPDGDV